MIYDVPSVDHSMIHPPAQQVVIPYREMPKAPSVPAIDVSKFSQKLAKRAAYRSSSQCAKFVRIALQSAGANIVQHPVAASDWGRTFNKLAIKKSNQSLIRNLVIFILSIALKTSLWTYCRLYRFTMGLRLQANQL
jgi:hypothetical protein